MVSIQTAWKHILKQIHNTGSFHYKDDALIKEIIDFNIFIDNPLSQITSNYDMLDKTKYIDFMKKGVFNIDGYSFKDESLSEYVLSFDDEDSINSIGFVYTYPQRIIRYESVDQFGKRRVFNQFKAMINRLINNSGTNRAIATMYHPGLDMIEEHIPCLQIIQPIIRNKSLYLSVYFRSNDIYMAFPANMYFISYIGLSMLEELKHSYPDLKFKGIYYHVSSAHYYTKFAKNVAKMVENGG